jgi:hypothetical protein
MDPLPRGLSVSRISDHEHAYVESANDLLHFRWVSPSSRHHETSHVASPDLHHYQSSRLVPIVEKEQLYMHSYERPTCFIDQPCDVCDFMLFVVSE